MYKKNKRKFNNRPNYNKNEQVKKESTGQKIVIAEQDKIAAVIENDKVSEFFVNKSEVLLNDVYLAKVDNILPSIEAAFVDVGLDKMGFLHTEDVLGKGELQKKLSPKQNIVVQVTKEPTGHKGPRVTMHLSLPGRFLVLMPNESGINVSKKISSAKERARLKSLVSLIKPVGVGVIIRTEALGKSDAEIQDDLETLLEKWQNIITASDTVKAPNLIHRDQDLIYRVIREACTDNTKEIFVDSTSSFNRAQGLLQTWKMNKDIKLNLYDGAEPILKEMGITKEIKQALQVKVNLPSGGYLYIQTTEALTVVDVNSGKFTSSATQDETIFKTNLEAVHEIARQLRLRNIGGMIIIDFIDMVTRMDKLAILEEFEIALEYDKAKPQIGQLSDLGLVELTRHRQGQTLSEIFTKKCPHCQGTGYFMLDIKFNPPVIEKIQEKPAGKGKKKPKTDKAVDILDNIVEVLEQPELIEEKKHKKVAKKSSEKIEETEKIENAEKTTEVKKTSKKPKTSTKIKEVSDKTEPKKVEKPKKNVEKQAKKIDTKPSEKTKTVKAKPVKAEKAKVKTAKAETVKAESKISKKETKTEIKKVAKTPKKVSKAKTEKVEK